MSEGDVPKCVAVTVCCASPTGSFGQVVQPHTKKGCAVRRKSLTLLSLLPVLAASLFFASCLAPDGPAGPTGTLAGTLQAVGGHPGAGPRALSGQVTLHGSSGHISGIAVGANGRFSVPVTVGSYTVSGRSPQYEGGTAVCRVSGPVVVTKSVTTNVQINCEE
jgi:hypothetical protein